MRLNEIRDNGTARRNRRRIGRGTGSGSGKTSGRGHKGQKSRSGASINGFEGGQMPITRRLPKRGFNNIFRKQYDTVNVGLLQEAIDAKRIDPKKPIDADALRAAGLIGKPRDGVRLLGQGEITAKVAIEVTGASAGAIAAVEKAGGSVTVLAPKKVETEPSKKDRKKAKKAKKAEAETDPEDSGEAAAGNAAPAGADEAKAEAGADEGSDKAPEKSGTAESAADGDSPAESGAEASEAGDSDDEQDDSKSKDGE